MRYACLLSLLFLTLVAWGFTPRAACWTAEGITRLAVLEGGQLQLARVTPAGLEEQGTAPAPGITMLAAGAWNGAPVLLGSRGKDLLRYDAVRQAWSKIGSAPATILQILPARDGAPAALLLTGEADEPVPQRTAVWWANWEKKFACTRVTAIKDTYRPWQLWWSAAGGEPRLAAATYKATKFAPFEHNCMFLFAWKSGTAESRWLGSRLTRPYVDATHADLHGDGHWRLVAVEETRDGGRGLSVYQPIQFGYANEWRTETIPGLRHIAAYGHAVICWTENGAAQLLPAADGYALLPLPHFPPSPDLLALIGNNRLAGRWLGEWHVIQLLPYP